MRLSTAGGLYAAEHGRLQTHRPRFCSALLGGARAAARGDGAGKAGTLNAYANKLSAQSGKALTAGQAGMLAQLAGSL